jgi:hypothetical protein
MAVMAQQVSEVWWIRGSETPTTPRPRDGKGDGITTFYRNMVDAERALEVTAQEYMASEYTTGGDRMESVVTPLLWSSDGNRFTTT